MRVVLKPLGIVIVLLTICLLAGLAVFWQSVAFRGRTGPGGGATVGDARGKILLVTSATKADWLRSHVGRFNLRNKGKAEVEVRVVETRQALQDILNGKVRPAVWAPDSAIWATRLEEAWEQKSPGKRLFNPADMKTYRTILRTPMVFLTSKDKAGFLRPRLSGGRAWQEMRKLASGAERTPWGEPLRFTFADPASTDAGFLALAMLLADYGRANDAGNLLDAAGSRGFRDYLSDLRKGYVFDGPAQKSTTELLDAAVQDPSRYDVVCTYEADAYKAAERNPELVLVYPEPTMVAEQSAALFADAPWVTPDQRAVALAFLDLLGDESALRDGIAIRFRPLRDAGNLSLNGELKRLEKQGARQEFTQAPYPPYEAVNLALARWRGAVPAAK